MTPRRPANPKSIGTQSLQLPAASSSSWPSSEIRTRPAPAASIAERHAQRRRLLIEGVRRTLEGRLDPVAGGLDRHDATAGAIGLGRLGRVEREGALGAEQIGHAHAGQHPGDRIGRVGDRHAQHGRGIAFAFGADPERRAGAPVARRAALERQLIAEKAQRGLRLLDLGDRVLRRIGFGVAAEEVEDAVLARIEPGRERRPGDRRLRRVGGRQHLIVARVAQPGEVRQRAIVHPALGELRIHAVEAEHDDAAAACGTLGGGRLADHGGIIRRSRRCVASEIAGAGEAEQGEERQSRDGSLPAPESHAAAGGRRGDRYRAGRFRAADPASRGAASPRRARSPAVQADVCRAVAVRETFIDPSRGYLRGLEQPWGWQRPLLGHPVTDPASATKPRLPSFRRVRRLGPMAGSGRRGGGLDSGIRGHRARSSASSPEQAANGPHQDGPECHDERDDHAPQRAQHRDPRAGPDIGECRRRKQTDRQRQRPRTRCGACRSPSDCLLDVGGGGPRTEL